MRISIKGINSLAQELQELSGSALDEAIKSKLSSCVDKIKGDAQDLAPKAVKVYSYKGKRHQPGRLKKSIKAMMHKSRGDIAGSVYAYYPEDKKDEKYYAFAPEYGTTHGGWRTTPSRPKPFLRPALLKNENYITTEISQAIDIAINRTMYGKSRLSDGDIKAIENQFGGNVDWQDSSTRGG